MRITSYLFLLLTLIFSGNGFGADTDPMMTKDIISLCATGKPEGEIIAILQTRGIGFEVNLPVMQKLVDGGVSPGVIETVLSLSSKNKSSANTVFQPSSPVNPGLTLVTDPPGMQIFIDDIALGVTPYMSNKIKKGEHRVRAVNPLFFTREETINLKSDSIYLNWSMEPREPILRAKVHVYSEEDELSWSWIIRPRENCPDPVSLDFTALDTADNLKEEAVFVLSDDVKRTFQGQGSTCLELFLWRGQIRNDLPIHRLPPFTARYFISGIQINGIQNLEFNISVEVKGLDPLNPIVKMDSSTGYLIKAEEKNKQEQADPLKAKVLEMMEIINE